MNKIVKIPFNDLLVSYRDVSDMINRACHHQHPMRVVGCCLLEDKVMLTLEPVDEQTGSEYVLAPMPSNNEDDVVAEIDNRYFAGFSTLSSFAIDETRWGLYEKPAAF